MVARRAPQGLGPESGATNPQAPVPTSSDRLPQLEGQVVEIRDGTIRDMQEELQRLSYEIEEINRRFGIFACTGETRKQEW